ncbi:mitochondrial carrier domain-containing protein [Geopyxis carbonaria]|nr:mitochondrial carrier domain-containing protein [Geopyxis carbonaria]
MNPRRHAYESGFPAWTGEDDAPSLRVQETEPRQTKTNVLQGSSAAGARALGTQLVAFYFRAPVKAFFRTRVDYMQVARALNPAVQANAAWSWHQTTPGLLAHAVRTYGWGFIPRQILPPLVANATVGAILYTSYLQVLGALHQPASQQTKRVYPPPPLVSTFQAGFAAGALQSAVAAPLDALVVRFKVSDMLAGGHRSIYAYSKQKLFAIGLRGVFAGYSLSFAKEALGYGCFFAAFEYVKQQAYFRYLTWYYGSRPAARASDTHVIRPHFALEPAFLLLAGASASIAQQVVQHPIAKVQAVHYGRLESIDYATKTDAGTAKTYRHAYEQTFEQCQRQAEKAGGWRRWVYRGLVMNTLRQMPSTSAGLIVFELVRRRFGVGGLQEGVTIEYEDRKILLS